MSALPSKTDIQIESNPRCEEALRLVRAWGLKLYATVSGTIREFNEGRKQNPK